MPSRRSSRTASPLFLTAVAIAGFALSATPAVAQRASKLAELTDFPEGAPFFGVDKAARARFIERLRALPPDAFRELPPKDDSTVRFAVTDAVEVPVAVREAAGAKEVWYEQWTRQTFAPKDGKPSSNHYDRTLFRCQPASYIPIGIMFDTTGKDGQPSLFADVEYLKVQMRTIDPMRVPIPLADNYRKLCGTQLDDKRDQALKDDADDLRKIFKARLVTLQAADRISREASAANAPADAASAPSGGAAALIDLMGLTPDMLQPDPELVTPEGRIRPARLRLFGANGKGAWIHRGSACVGGNDTIHVSGGLGTSFQSLMGTTSNLSIGMPSTKNLEAFGTGGMIGTRRFYQEHTIPGAEPTTISLNNDGCKTINASFIPVPGADYEATLQRTETGQMCMLQIYKIAADSTVRPVRLTSAPECSKPGEPSADMKAAAEAAAAAASAARASLAKP